MSAPQRTAFGLALVSAIWVSGCAPSSVPEAGLDDPGKKDVAMQLVSSAENSSLDTAAQYGYIEDIGDGRGYTGGTIGFTSGTGDMLAVVTGFTQREPGNALQQYVPALEAAVGSDTHGGLGDEFVTAWRAVASDASFRAAQDAERDREYFEPAVAQAKTDGLRALGQFVYYDAIVVHGDSDQWPSLSTIRDRAAQRAAPPTEGGDEIAYLSAFLDVRADAMRAEAAHLDTSRVDTEQRKFLRDGNLDLHLPLTWSVYGEQFTIE